MTENTVKEPINVGQLNFENAEQIVTNYCNASKININQDIFNKLKIYYSLLIEWNQKINLTAITELEEAYQKHFADSVTSVNYLKQNSSLCDIGTGAGFPGLVIAIFRPDLKVTLVDSLQKRINFLNIVIESLKLTNVTTIHANAEDSLFKAKFLNSFDYVVSRAVANLCSLSEYCIPYVKVGGTFIAYKTEKANDEILESKVAINLLGGSTNVKVVPYQILGANNTLVFINKSKPTSNKYPRGQNKARLKPLK